MFKFFVPAARLFLVFASIHLPCCRSAHKSLAPRARTLLRGLGQETLSFFAVVTLLFVFFCEQHNATQHTATQGDTTQHNATQPHHEGGHTPPRYAPP